MIVHRDFPSYDDYVYKQGRKARGHSDFLLRHLEKKTDWYRKIFKATGISLQPGPILCLGARTGAENLGAVRAGFTGSVGVDLFPIGPSVQQGDWHDLPFTNESFANVYCNSLDHCLYLDKLASEVKRVLKPFGRFYVMASNRSQPIDVWIAKGKNEALYWPTSDDLLEALVARGFTDIVKWRRGKWGHYILGVK